MSIGTTARIFEQALGWSPDEAIRGGPRTRPAALAAAHDAALAAAAHPQVSRLRQDLELRLDALVAAGPGDEAALVFDTLKVAVERAKDDVQARRAAVGGRLPLARRRAQAALARAERHDAEVQRLFTEVLRAIGGRHPSLRRAS